MSEKAESCVKPSKGPIVSTPENAAPGAAVEKEIPMVQARVGKPAPDFELSAFIGNGFKNIRLSDYKGKWLVVCFYPGDFTFV